MTYQNLTNASPTVLVEFFATWCPHCKRMMPVVDEVKELLGDTVPVYQIDIDKETETADSVDINTVPTFIVYRNGKEVWRQSGEMDSDALFQKVQSLMKGTVATAAADAG